MERTSENNIVRLFGHPPYVGGAIRLLMRALAHDIVLLPACNPARPTDRWNWFTGATGLRPHPGWVLMAKAWHPLCVRRHQCKLGASLYKEGFTSFNDDPQRAAEWVPAGLAAWRNCIEVSAFVPVPEEADLLPGPTQYLVWLLKLLGGSLGRLRLTASMDPYGWTATFDCRPDKLEALRRYEREWGYRFRVVSPP